MEKIISVILNRTSFILIYNLQVNANNSCFFKPLKTQITLPKINCTGYLEPPPTMPSLLAHKHCLTVSLPPGNGDQPY